MLAQGDRQGLPQEEASQSVAQAVGSSCDTFDIGDSDSSVGVEGFTWEEAESKAEVWQSQHRSNAECLQKSIIDVSIAFKLRPEQSEQLGADFGKVITAVEIYSASRDPKWSGEIEQAIGRAKGPRLKLRRVIDHLGCAGPLGR